MGLVVCLGVYPVLYIALQSMLFNLHQYLFTHSGIITRIHINGWT